MYISIVLNDLLDPGQYSTTYHYIVQECLCLYPRNVMIDKNYVSNKENTIKMWDGPTMLTKNEEKKSEQKGYFFQ